MLDLNLKRYIETVNEGKVIHFPPLGRRPASVPRTTNLPKSSSKGEIKSFLSKGKDPDWVKQHHDEVSKPKKKTSWERFNGPQKKVTPKTTSWDEFRGNIKAHVKATNSGPDFTTPKRTADPNKKVDTEDGFPAVMSKRKAAFKTAKEIGKDAAATSVGTAALGFSVGSPHGKGASLAALGGVVGAAVGLGMGLKNAKSMYKRNRIFGEEEDKLFSDAELAHLERTLSSFEDK